MTSPQEIKKTAIIDSSPSVVWKALTDPSMMKLWMAEPEMELDVETNWIVGSPIRIRGFHHAKFENKGSVLAFEPNSLLRYSHLSSVSRLPDKPPNYTILEFWLTPWGKQTELTVAISNFPTVSIFKHFDFYWSGTIAILKNYVEKLSPRNSD